MVTDPARTLAAGVEILAPVLERHGFTHASSAAGDSSGGRYASSMWERGRRRVELHFRNSLGLVRYHLGDTSIAHEDYMWAVTGERNVTEYPGFSDDPLDGFRHLRSDLEKYASCFLSGSDASFLEIAHKASELKQKAPRLPG